MESTYFMCITSLEFLSFLNLDFSLFLLKYKTSKEGSSMGIAISQAAMLAHCHVLSQSCRYNEGELVVLKRSLVESLFARYTYLT